MLYECVYLSLKKKFFFINLLQELVIIFSFTGDNKFYTFFAKKKFNMDYNSYPKTYFYKIISSSLLNCNKIVPAKNFYHDIFKMMFQKFIFLLLSSFPSYIICESDFGYLSTGVLFFFFSIPNNLIRFTSILLFLSILDISTKTILKKNGFYFQKKIWKILSLNYIKEISILGKIKTLDNNLNFSKNNYFLFKNRKLTKHSGIFIEDILIFAKKNINSLKMIKLNEKQLSLGTFYKNIFVLNYTIPCNSILNKLLKADKLRKNNFLIILKDKKKFITFCEFIFILSLKVCLKCLKKKLKNCFNLFFYIQNFFIFSNVIEKKDYLLTNVNYIKKNSSNYYIKLFAITELISQKNNNSLKNFFFKNLHGLFFWRRSPLSIKNKNSNIELIRNFIKHFFHKFFLVSPSFLAFDMKEQYTEFKNLTGISFNRIIVFKEKSSSFPQKCFWIDTVTAEGSLIMVSKFLKKLPIKNFIISYYKVLNIFTSFDININRIFYDFSFFSRDELMKKYIFFYFFIKKKILLIENFSLMFHLFIKNVFDRFTSSLDSISVNKILARFKKIKKVFNYLKTRVFSNLFFKTQILSKKVQCISNINIIEKKAVWNELDILVSYPSSMAFYLSLILQILRKRRTWFQKMSLCYSIKENDYLKVNGIFKKKEMSVSLFSENKHSFIFNFILRIKNLDRYNELYSKKLFYVFKKNVNKFWKMFKIFINYQLDGIYWFYHKNILLEKEVKTKIVKINVSIQDYKSFGDSLTLYPGLHKFKYKKKVIDFVAKLPYKTTLNKILL
jgi:hypothetical protein